MKVLQMVHFLIESTKDFIVNYEKEVFSCWKKKKGHLSFSVKDHNGDDTVSLADFNGKESGVMVLSQGRYAGLHY